MRMDDLAPLLRSRIGFDRPLPSRRRGAGLRWISSHRRHDDDDDPPPAPAAMRLAVPERVEARREAAPALLLAA